MLVLPTMVGIFYLFQVWRHFRRMTQTREIDREIGAARAASNSWPAGIAQRKDFVARLKRIDTEGAPRQVREALADYVSALEAAVDAYDTGKNPRPYDFARAQAQERAAVAITNYWY